MIYHVLTLFPEMIEQGLNTSILGKAQEKELIKLNMINIRDFAENRYKHVDDYPFGGGAGMVMQVGPILNAYNSISSNKGNKQRVIYLTPQGKTFNQKMALELAEEKELIFLCGHYEGIDERVIDEIVTDEISIGDYVLTGGELAVMVIIDAVSRLLPGVLNNDESKEAETFYDGLLEYPQYTRPADYKGLKVPEVLLSGHHENIEKWRREQSLLRTALKRPDLLDKANLTDNDKKNLEKLLHR